jgi:hypothetical protein
MDEAEYNNLGDEAKEMRWGRWHTCSLCEQEYHGVVKCALAWACWKTYVGRPETDLARRMAMNLLGLGLDAADLDEDALSVREAELAMLRRIGATAHSILVTQGNLALTYSMLGRHGEANRMLRDVYSGRLKLNGEEHPQTLIAASNYAASLIHLQRIEEAKEYLREKVPVARRVLGEGNNLTLKMRKIYAKALFRDAGAALDDLREAVNTLEDTDRVARRVFGGAHPTVSGIEYDLQNARAALAAREGDVESVRAAVEAMAPGDA